MKQVLVNEVIRRDHGCVAPLLDPSGSGPCSGRWTLEHVNDQSTRGKRAPDDREHLVVLCELHAGLLRVAGEQWNTKKENRYRLRRYLWRTYDLMCHFHGCEMKAVPQNVSTEPLCQGHADMLGEGVFI